MVPEEKILLVHATAVVRKKKTEGAVMVFHNITELRHLENIRRDFVANVSHELRTPLTNIKGYAETLLEGALNDKKNAKEFLEIIHTDSDRLARLVDDLLDLSRLESGQSKLDLKACSMALVAKKVISLLKKEAEDKSISISTEMVKDEKVLADESKISQVLLNLIDNAIKYTPENGTISISAQAKAAVVEVRVSDTGIGISDKDLPRIFERFYRVDKARSRELGGTGLGLSIVKHIVQEHKGSVRVESLVGQGSTFTFTLPKA
jgi:two-component system phosphate regulon sensor histidine kinase PhoR